MKDKNIEYELVKLVTVFDMFKAAAIRGILEDNNITFFEISNEKDAYLNPIVTTGNFLGINFLVPDFLLEQSQDLIKFLFGDDYNNFDLKE